MFWPGRTILLPEDQSVCETERSSSEFLNSMNISHINIFIKIG